MSLRLDKIEVLFICRSLDPNRVAGVYKSAWYIYNTLKKYDDIRVFPFFIPNSINISGFIGETIVFFRLLSKIKRKFNKGRTIVYVHNPDDILPSLGYILRYPTILVLHDIIPLFKKDRRFFYNLYFKILHIFLRTLIKHRKIVIMVPSNTTKRDLTLYHFIKSRVFVNYWGVDTSRYKPIPHLQKEKYSRNRYIIGFLGGWLGKNKRKRVDILLDAFIKIRQNYDNVELWLAGKYPKWFLEKNKLSIRYFGILDEDEIPEFYNKLDIFVYPSEYEGFGMQILEAIACKTLVLASDIPTFREFLPKQLLFKLNSNSLAEKLIEFLDKNKIRKWTDRLYHKYSKGKFSWENTVYRLYKIIKKIV